VLLLPDTFIEIQVNRYRNNLILFEQVRKYQKAFQELLHEDLMRVIALSCAFDLLPEFKIKKKREEKYGKDRSR
jgi:hypothetical protein